MIVFCNTTPLIALSSIEKLDLLPCLFDRVYVVSEVIEECTAGGPNCCAGVRRVGMDRSD